MAQVGFHGLIGVGLGRLLAPGGPQGALGPGEGSGAQAGAPSGSVKDDPGGNWRWGLVVGSILPDADLFLLGPLYLVNSQLGLAMHRTFTHSIVTAALVLAYFRRRSGGGRDKAMWSLGLGVAVGMAVHALTDLVFWFSGVDLLWPLGLLGLPSWINFWENWTNPPLVPKLLGAADYLALALFFLYARRRAQAVGTDLGFVPRVNRYFQLSLVLWLAYTALALTPISASLFDMVHYAVFIVVLLPMLLQTAVRMRATFSAPWPTARGALGNAPAARG